MLLRNMNDAKDADDADDANDTYIRIDGRPFGIAISKQSTRGGAVGMQLEIVELKRVVLSVQDLGELVAGDIGGNSWDNWVDHCG